MVLKNVTNAGITRHQNYINGKTGIWNKGIGASVFICQYCGKEKTVRKKNDIRKFCSSKCLSNWIKNGMDVGRREKISKTTKLQYKNGMRELPKGSGGKWKSGYRADLSQYFRSTYEANLARVLNLHHIAYEYESKVCRFVLGDRVYICDFYLPDLDKYIEVKGYLTDACKEKLKKFVELFPIESNKAYILDIKAYKRLATLYKDVIPGWEKS
jgi:endogenous inhibitor of DNA gyrase (YacG/DUF329 family)